jgi:hypothetical protein
MLYQSWSTAPSIGKQASKIVAAYLSSTRPLIDSDLTACLSGGLPVLMAGDLNAKHTDWNTRLITARGALLRDFADRNALSDLWAGLSHHCPLPAKH